VFGACFICIVRLNVNFKTRRRKQSVKPKRLYLSMQLSYTCNKDAKVLSLNLESLENKESKIILK